MNLLMTADAVGGVWQYAQQLAALLSERGVEVLLATMGPEPSDEQRREVLAIPRLRLRTSDFALEWMVDALGDVDRAAEWLLQLETEFSPDIVHLNGFAHGNLPWRGPALVVAHSCVYSWWDAVHGGAAPDEWAQYASRVRAGLIAATCVAAPSRAMAEALTRAYRVVRDVRIVPNCRDANAWTPGVKEPLIFAAGRVWDPSKNLGALDTVAGDLAWPVYVAGDATGPDGHSAAFRSAHQLGRLSGAQVATWMSRAAIYALPARYEPFGLSVLEAALSGCALVLGDIPSLRENWSGVARFVHPDRPEELRRALDDLIDAPTERKVAAAAARARGESFSRDKHVAAYEQLYRETVTSHDRLAHTTRTL